MENNEAVFQSMAKEMVEEIERKIQLQEPAVFICPVGPVGQYPYFIELVNSQKISLHHVWFINMDEYLDDNKQWIPIESKLSFRGFMERSVYSKIDPELIMPKEQRIFPDPNKLEEIPNLIEKLGGVDLVIGGIGINGHVAFNEPQEDLTKEQFLSLRTRVLEIAKETRVVNSIADLNGAFEEMPKYCVTLGMNEISGARKIRLGVFRDWHRAVIRRTAFGEESTNFPVSLLHSHKDINIKLTEFVANLEH